MNAMSARDEEASFSDDPVAPVIPEARSSSHDVRRAVEDLRALRQEMERRQGFEPLSDQEIRDAIDVGRP